MFAYKEMLTLDNPQQLKLKKPLPFLKGKRVEVLVIVEDDFDEIKQDETEYVAHNKILNRQIEASMKTHRLKTGYSPTEEELNAILSV